jgi:hypothetical protein
LAATGAAHDWSFGDGTDFHLLTLRALALHQRSTDRPIEPLIDFWKRQATDLRYTSIAIQALLRIAPHEAFSLIPGFVERASKAHPRIPLVNLLFAIAVGLQGNLTLWRSLAARLIQTPGIFDLVKEGFGRIQLAQSNHAAWCLFSELDLLTKAVITDRGEVPVRMMRNHDVLYQPIAATAIEQAA